MADKRYEGVEVVTGKPVAVDSPDHIFPVGAKNDNHTSARYIQEVENYFGGKQLNVMDLGCAGGQLAVDFSHRGHFSLGIEGSTYPRQAGRHNWNHYYQKILHTADLTEPYHIERNGERVLFDCISAWEVVEHIHPDDLNNFFDYILSNLKPDGIFVASVNVSEDKRTLPDGTVLHIHQSVFPQEKWLGEILADRNLISYPFRSAVRGGPSSFNICMKRKDDE